MNDVNFKWVKQHGQREKAMGKGMLKFKKHQEMELWKMQTNYKNKMTKLLPIVANLAHEIEFFELLKGNFIIIEQE